MNTIEKQINSLEIYLGNEGQNADVTLSAIAKLRRSHEMAKNSEWSKKELTELLLSENDLLDIDGAQDFPGSMRDEISEIQHGIINYYAAD